MSWDWLSPEFLDSLPEKTITFEGLVEPYDFAFVPVESSDPVKIVTSGEELPVGVRLFALRLPDGKYA